MRAPITLALTILLGATAADAQVTTAKTSSANNLPNVSSPYGGGYLGGTDDCNGGSVAIGSGDLSGIPFDTSAATTGTEHQNESLCYAFGTSGIDTDVWFQWSQSGSNTNSVLLSICAQSSSDTKVASYDDDSGGNCPTGSALACNDDTCGLQSEITWAVTSGGSYVIQLGTFPGGAPGSGTFSLTESGGSPGVPFCFGDGTGTPCPCGNEDLGGSGGCVNTTGMGSTLSATGSESVSADDLVLTATNAIAAQPGLFFQGNDALNGGNGVIFGDGLRCSGTNVIRLQVVFADGSGTASSTVDIAAMGGVLPGDTRFYQFWYRDPGAPGGVCGTGFNLANGWQTTWRG